MDTNLETLRQWYEEYLALEVDVFVPLKECATIQTVNSDELTEDMVEKRIRAATSGCRVTRGFCTTCQHLLNSWPDLRDDPEGNRKHVVARTFRTIQLEASMRNGCVFCAFLVQRLKDCKLFHTFRNIEARFERLGEGATASLSVQNWSADGSTQTLWLNPPGKVCTDCAYDGAYWTEFHSGLIPEQGEIFTEPPGVFNLAKTWLNLCSRNHDTCKSNSQAMPPTRLISVASDVPRLALTKDMATKPPYATLSHCWGGKDFLKLTRGKLESFMSAIPTSRLPQTFKDAIEVTRSLGIEFLWIDSLCIIQDDDSDWDKEAAIMGSVYGNSFINIAASSAIDATRGCFTKPTHFIDGFRAKVTTLGVQKVRQFRAEDIYEENSLRTHLATRAWTLQEKLLPPRTLHLGDRGAFWEYRSVIASECFPDGLSHITGPSEIGLVCQNTFTRSLSWAEIVQLYSAAHLTFDKDKLPALSGVAQLHHGRTGDRYFAGLWRTNIEPQLCWTADEVPVKRPSPHAPTWSWASVNGKVDLQSQISGYSHEYGYAHVLEANVTLAGCDAFGEVSSGVIRLCFSSMLAGKPGHISPSGEQSVLVKYGEEEGVFPFSKDCSDDCCFGTGDTVYFLPILGGKTGSLEYVNEGQIPELMIQGIVLRKSDQNVEWFHRVASFRYWGDAASWRDITHDYYQPFRRMQQKYGGITAMAVCAENTFRSDYPEEPYVIMIV